MFDFLKTKKGDIRICKGRHGILKEQDRFSNMLIVDPRGYGGSPESVLPMILQDIKNPAWGVTVIGSQGDVALQACILAHANGRECIYFDPTDKYCPKFNPLAGPEDAVVKNLVAVFKLVNPDSPQYYLDLNEKLLSNAVKVLKRLDRIEGVEGKYSTLICLERLLSNPDGWGMELVDTFHETYCLVPAKEIETCENQDIVHWFMTEYFQKDSKIYKDTSGIRAQIGKLVSNEYLRPVLNPDSSKGNNYIIDFDKNLANGTMICISTAKDKLRELSQYLNYFFITALQTSILHRPGTEPTRRPHAVYISDFTSFATTEIRDVLSQSRSLQISMVLTTKGLAYMEAGRGETWRGFGGKIASLIKNTILHPGLNNEDVRFFSKQFGVSCVNLWFWKRKKKDCREINYIIEKNGEPQPLATGYISGISKKLKEYLNNRVETYRTRNTLR